MRAQFAEASKSTIELTENTKKFEEVSAAGLIKGGAVAGAFIAALVGIGKELDNIVTLSEDRPELFDAQQLNNVQEYDNALNQLKDSVTELKVEIGTQLMPAITDMFLGLAHTNEIRDRANELVKEGASREQALAQASQEVRDATRSVVDANEELIDQSPDLASAVREQTAEYRELLSISFSIQRERERAEESTKRLTASEQELNDQIIRENLAYGELINSGELSQDQIDNHIVKVDELQKKLAENAEAQKKLTEDTEDATKRRIYNTIEEGLAKDGINAQEYEFLQQYQVTQGLITKADADRAIAERAAAESVIADYERQNAITDVTQQKLNALVNGSPYVAQIRIDTVGGVPSLGGMSSGVSNAFSRQNRLSVAATAGGHLGRHKDGGDFIVPGTGNVDKMFTIGLTPGEQVSINKNGEKGSESKIVNLYITGILDNTMVKKITQAVSREMVQ